MLWQRPVLPQRSVPPAGRRAPGSNDAPEPGADVGANRDQGLV